MARPKTQIQSPKIEEEGFVDQDAADDEVRTDAPASDLVGYLESSGTPRDMLHAMRDWLKTQDEPTAEALYRHLDQEGAKQGTLRKAGKFIWGSGFEPESVVKLAPADELLRLRGENDRLAATVETARAQVLGLTQQNTYLREELNAANRKVTFLSIGKTKDELDAIGASAPIGAKE